MTMQCPYAYRNPTKVYRVVSLEYGIGFLVFLATSCSLFFYKSRPSLPLW